jgi:hypothetical protein
MSRPVGQLLAALAFLVLTAPAWPADTSGLALRGSTAHIVLYAAKADARDYAPLLGTLEESYVRIRDELKPAFSRKVSVYVYPDQRAFVKAAFGWTTVEMNVAGLADHVTSALYITSVYDTCKPAEHMQKMPIHELTHVIYHQDVVWLREGIAHYEAGLLTAFDATGLPQSIPDLRFNGTDKARDEAYNGAGWIVKYVVDRVLAGDARRLPSWVSSSVDKSGRILPSEPRFFQLWRTYMIGVASGLHG